MVRWFNVGRFFVNPTQHLRAFDIGQPRLGLLQCFLLPVLGGRRMCSQAPISALTARAHEGGEQSHQGR